MHATAKTLYPLGQATPRAAVPARLAQRREAIAEALSLLVEARDYAAYLRRDNWDFAVELVSLRSTGLTDSEIRFLVCMGYLRHRHEKVNVASNGVRHFCQEDSIVLCDQSCFVLTEAGEESLQTLVPRACTASGSNGHPEKGCRVSVTEPLIPVWDGERQELRVGECLVKQYKLPSPNQEMILSSFQEEGWPVRIDDPLPPVADILPKRRLHDTIKSLNRSQKCNLIRFLGDGSGEGVRWELQRPESMHTAID